MIDEEYIYREKDVDMEEINKLCAGMTAEEIDAEYERLKKEIAKERGIVLD